MSPLLIGLIVVIVLVVLVMAAYNGLVTARNRVKESWSGIDVQLKRRSSLIPNLIETVKSYAAHEKEVFEKVTAARSAVVNAGNAHEAADANNMLTGALKSLFAVAEAYPDLKANTNFMQLQEELSDTESKIAAARQFYNTNVLEYNTKIQTVPNVLFSGALGFHPEEYFKVSEEEKADIKVDFKSN